jgi:branched-chain amino acid transport system substrate-binding protein
MANGIEMAVEEINKNGGVDGKTFEIVKVDNKSEAAEATNGIIKLTSQDKVTAVMEQQRVVTRLHKLRLRTTQKRF